MSESFIPCVRPDEDALREFVRILARGAMSPLSRSDLVNWAIAALERGFDSMALRLLAGLSSGPSDFDVGELVAQLVEQFKIEVPPPARLLEIYAAVIAGDILNRNVSVREGCRLLKELALLNPPKASTQWIILDEELDLAREGYESLEHVESNVVAAARELLATNSDAPSTR
jgi:hypothetical protein